jgi:CheY-like chemotaxis protein
MNTKQRVFKQLRLKTSRRHGRIRLRHFPLLPHGLLAVLLLAVTHAHAANPTETKTNYAHVLSLHPVGYWPLDEGAGDVIYDRSGGGNDGMLINTIWDGALLDFIGGYQWAEIPASPTYQSQSFTIGGWLFSRKAEYKGGTMFVGIADKLTSLVQNAAVYLHIGDTGQLEIFSGGENDVIGSEAEDGAINLGQWQLVLYSYGADGTAKLYIDGQLVQSATDVPFDADKMEASIFVGPHCKMWGIRSSGSLNGSVRDVMLFDRPLAATEVMHLYEKTRPNTTPQVSEFTDTIIDLDGRGVDLDRLPEYPLDVRLAALNRLLQPPGVHPVEAQRELRAKADLFRPILIQALEDWQTAHLAAEGLRMLGDDAAKAAMQAAVPNLIETLQDTNATNDQRLGACATLGEMHGQAKAAVPALVDALQGLLEQEGVRLPRVEDHFRNSLLRALLNVERNDPTVSEILGQAMGKPFLALLDLDQPYLVNVKPLVEAGRYMDALDACRQLKLPDYGDRFFSQNDPHRDDRTDWDIHLRSYTPTADYNGFTYKLGGGKAYEGGTLMSAEAYGVAVEKLAIEYPAAAEWRADGNVDDLYQLKITKTDAAGNEEMAYLEGDWLIFSGIDAKVHAWSIGIDKQGYLHIMGGQHNRPKPDHYIPGSWERIGLSRDANSEAFPQQLYWVSTEPGSIDSFEFVGLRNNPRHLPPSYWNYMNFIQDNEGELFVYGRININSLQSFGFYRYDAANRDWSAIGGQASDIIVSCDENDPGWSDRLVRQVRGGIPRQPGDQAFAWAWQAHFYNYCRSNWGVRFDPDNRMHIELPIHGLVDRRVMRSGSVYAYSDDGGETFHRVDGSSVELPLTINPSPDHNADLRNHDGARWWNLWRSLVSEAGY